jgi:sensor histidine kinase regulating citrate/malate metabolism
VQRLAREAGYVAMVSLPLIASGAPLATLDLYSDRGGDWLGDGRPALMDFIRFAAGAIEISLARDEQRARMEALDGLVTALRYEAHEYASRLHVLSSLLCLEDTDAARRFVDELTALHHTGPVADLSRIANPVVAGMLAGHMSAARAKAATLVFDERSRLDALPVGLSDAGAVTLFANLLDNALDAAAEMSGLRRRVEVALEQHRDGITVEVRDWGRGLHDAAPSSRPARPPATGTSASRAAARRSWST